MLPPKAILTQIVCMQDGQDERYRQADDSAQAVPGWIMARLLPRVDQLFKKYPVRWPGSWSFFWGDAAESSRS